MAKIYFIGLSKAKATHQKILLLFGPTVDQAAQGWLDLWLSMDLFGRIQTVKLCFLNEHSWNTIANMLYIETPAGVGFSYSNTPSDYHTGDAQTASDNYKAILLFLERFPEYSASDFYITSESYGGHYMPTLAKAIVDGNNAGVNPHLNFKGFAVGNPYTDTESNTYGTFAAFWGHQLVSKISWDNYLQHCPVRPLACANARAQMNTEIGNLNPYALDFGVCASPTLRAGRAQRTWLMHYITDDKKIRRQFAIPPTLSAYDPCVDNYATTYLNQDYVQTALHAKPTNWRECSLHVVYNQTDKAQPMEPYYRYLIDEAKIKILVYSGDDDSVCATVGTQEWIYKLGYQITAPWTAWTLPNDEQVAGYITRFQGLNFVTVHTAGHEVPTYQPERALQLFQNFLNGDF